jgi:hypothetical protein
MPVFSSAESATAHNDFIEWVEAHPVGSLSIRRV